jgi:hypothetical protein
MVLTISAVIRISVERGATSKIGEARFWERGLTISPPEFLKYFPVRIFRKKMAGEDPLDPLLVAGGHRTEAPATITYASVVSREHTMHLALTIASLNDLEVKVGDVLNAYITALVKEKV